MQLHFLLTAGMATNTVTDRDTDNNTDTDKDI